MPADRGRYPPPAVAIPSLPAGCLVPWLPLPQARRWLKPAGSPLTQARRPPLTLAPWIQSTRHGQECRVYVLSCPQELFKYLVLSTETRQGQGAPLVMAEEVIPSRLPPCRGCGSGSWGNLGRAPDVVSCPEEASASKLAQEGFLFLWAVLSCPVCLAPEGGPVLSCLSSPGGLSCSSV